MQDRFWLLALPVLAAAATAAPLDIETLRAQRRELAFRQRGLIMNNDGCDVLYFPRTAELTPEAFLDLRTTNLADTQVGTISYCTISSGFSFFTHDTKVGTLLARQAHEYGIQEQRRNIAAELVEQGADCLQLVVDYAHANGMEAFWSMRMNDTHDVAHHPDRPYLLFPPLKEQHPEWLVGDPVARTPHGRWSSVNYAIPEIRDLAFRYIEEVCANYDVDGIELDFFRHLCYFPSTARGGRASDEEREAMTSLIRRLRAMTEEIGLRRGRPILVAVRVPDSIEFSRGIGLDIEQWLREGLADILVTTCYFRFHPWDWTVSLARQYGVAAYPGLSESRVRGETRFLRRSLPAYRARATNAWFAGADGIYIFNQFNPNSPIWNELGSPASLLGQEKLYFVGYRDGRPGAYLKESDGLRVLPSLMPGQGLPLKPGETRTVEIMVGEDIAAARQAGFVAAVTACVEVPGIGDPARLSLSLNGQSAGTPAVTGNWLDFPVDATHLRQGLNRLEFTLAATAAAATGPEWPVHYAATALPERPWTSDRAKPGVVFHELREEGLLIADRGTNSGDYFYFRYPWGKEPGGKAVFEVEVKVLEGTSSVLFGDGESGDRLRFYPDHVRLHHSPQHRVELDTTEGFRTYRMEIDGADLTLFIDGEKRLEAPGAFQPRPGRNDIAFGAANSPETGEAIWKHVRARGGEGTFCNDFALRIRYEAPAE